MEPLPPTTTTSANGSLQMAAGNHLPEVEDVNSDNLGIPVQLTISVAPASAEENVVERPAANPASDLDCDPSVIHRHIDLMPLDGDIDSLFPI